MIFGLPALITLLAAGALTMSGHWKKVVIAILVVGNLAGIVKLRSQGFNDAKGYWAMKSIAKEISRPIEGEKPTVVAIWLFPFFDALATVGDKQRVVNYRVYPPNYNTFPDVLYYDHPEWLVLSLDEVKARHVWMLEDVNMPPQDVPSNWKLKETHRRGYARTRLFTVSPR